MAINQEPVNVIETDSSDDDSDSSKEAGSQESGPELELTLKPKNTSSSTPAAAKKPQSASKPPPFESGADSESDPIPTQKPTNGSGSKPPSPGRITPAESVSRKRRAEENETDEKSSKKAEPDTTEKKPTDDPKKTVTKKVWCDDDEIVILKGVVDYTAAKKVDPFVDFSDFFDFIKKDLQKKDSNKSQFQDKVRRLKIKYEYNRMKEQGCSKGMAFPNPHERKVYELSKRAWENKNVKGRETVWTPKANAIPLRMKASATKEESKGGAAVTKEESKGRVADVDAETESVLLAKSMKSFGVAVEERILTIGTEMFENGKGDAEGKEWNNLRMEEMEVYLRYMEVKAAQARLVIGRLKSKGM